MEDFFHLGEHMPENMSVPSDACQISAISCIDFHSKIFANNRLEVVEQPVTETA